MAVAAPGDLDLDLRPGDLDVAFRNGDRDGFLGTGGMGGRKVGFRSFLGGGWLGSASSSEESRGLSPPESSPAMSIAIATDESLHEVESKLDKKFEDEKKQHYFYTKTARFFKLTPHFVRLLEGIGKEDPELILQ